MSRTGWLGFLLFAALLLLGFATLLIRGISLGAKTTVQVYFDRVLGLQPGNDVRVDGVLMGKVDRIRLHQPAGVMVALSLNEPITFTRDSEISVETSSVLGGYVVSIRRGTQPETLDLSQPLKGKTRAGFEEFTDLASENRENLKQLISNLKDVTQSLRDGQGTVGKLLKSDELHKETVDTVKAAREALSDVRAEVKRLGDTMNQNVVKLTDKVTEKLDKAEGPVGALLNDKKMTEKLTRTLDSVEETSRNLKEITESIRKGEGALGRMVHDKEMGDKLKSTLDNIERASDSIRTVTGRLETGEGTVGRLLQEDDLYEQARRVVGDLDKTLGRAARATLEIVGESKFYTDSEMRISKLGIRIGPSDDKYFLVGAAVLSLGRDGDIRFEDQIEENDDQTIIKGDIQLAYRVPWFLDRRLTVRGGLVEGKGGGAADLTWQDWGLFTHPVQFTVEARDAYNSVDDEDIDEEIRGPMMRAYAKTPLWTRKDSWFELLLSTPRAYAGVSRIGARPEWMAGIGVEWPDEDLRTLVALIGIAR